MLYAAFEKVDITPFDLRRCYLAGFNPGRTAKGVLDKLWARVLYLTDGKRELALVVCDLIGLPNHVVREIRARVPELAGSEIHIFCTHVHSGPDMIGLWGPAIAGVFPVATGVDEGYQEWLVSEIAYGIRRAAMRPEAVKPYFAQAELVNELDGKKIIDNVNERDFFDKNISILVLRGEGGRNLAALCHMTAHPETLWKMNRLVSSDIFGPLRRELEGALNANALVFNGAIGGMVTSALDESMRLAERYVWMELQGKALADQFTGLAESAKPIGIGSIATKSVRLELPLKNELFYFMANMGVLNKPSSSDRLVSTEVVRIRLGPVEILGLPGEALPAIGDAAKRLSGAKYPLVFSLANDEIGYILPAEYYDDSKYSYECSMSLGRGTAEALIEALDELG